MPSFGPSNASKMIRRQRKQNKISIALKRKKTHYRGCPEIPFRIFRVFFRDDLPEYMGVSAFTIEVGGKLTHALLFFLSAFIYIIVR